MNLLSPSTIKKRLLKIAKDLGDKKFDVEMFKKNYQELFWNAVWFFEVNHLDTSFMLPYCYETCNYLNENQSEKLKKSIIYKSKRDVDVDIERIIAHNDLTANIIFYGNVKALGKNINQEEIKNNVFTIIENSYDEDDLVIQNVFEFYLSDKTGMISYLEFNNFSDNIGYNEYPDKFEIIPSYERLSLTSLYSRTNTKMSESIVSTNSLISNKNSIKKSVNFSDGNSTSKALTNSNSKLNKSGKGILKRSKKFDKTSFEIKNKKEDFDFLSKFKESQKKIENDLKRGKDKSVNNNNNINVLRKSTLKSGILFENENDKNDDYYDE